MGAGDPGKGKGTVTSFNFPKCLCTPCNQTKTKTEGGSVCQI